MLALPLAVFPSLYIPVARCSSGYRHRVVSPLTQVLCNVPFVIDTGVRGHPC